MSKKIISIKSIIDFFCLNTCTDSDKIIKAANELICEYNKRDKNERKLVSCNQYNLNSWLSIPLRLQNEIKNSSLEKIYQMKFDNKMSYIKICQNDYISETTFYSKVKSIYELAINYIYYERLFIIGDYALEPNWSGNERYY